MINNRSFMQLFPGYTKKPLQGDGIVGFSILKPYEPRKGYVSLMRVYINLNSPQKANRYQIITTVSFGKFIKERNSISMNPFEGVRQRDPIDITSKDYFFDAKSKQVFKNNQKILGHNLIDELFKTHLKSTRRFSGLFIRSKVFFNRLVLPTVLGMLIDLLSFLLYIITGNRYRYSYLFDEEIQSIENTKQINQELKPGKKLKIFDYEASLRVIVAYSIIHLTAYALIELLHLSVPNFVHKLFSNTFLTALYAIVTLAILDVLLPKATIGVIKKISRLRGFFESRPLKV